MDVSDHTILLFLGIADGNIEDQRLEQIHFGAVPEVIAFLATGILDDDVTKTSRIRYKTDNPEALICLLSGRPPVRVWSGVPKNTACWASRIFCFVIFLQFSAYRSLPSPPMRAVISSMRSRGNGGALSGRMAMLMSFIGLSSAATRLELSAPQRLQRWMIAHSPPLRTQTATGSMMPPQSLSRSPGSMSTCRLDKQFGQWLRWSLPAFSGVQSRPQTLQVKVSRQAWVL